MDIQENKNRNVHKNEKPSGKRPVRKTTAAASRSRRATHASRQKRWREQKRRRQRQLMIEFTIIGIVVAAVILFGIFKIFHPGSSHQAASASTEQAAAAVTSQAAAGSTAGEEAEKKAEEEAKAEAEEKAKAEEEAKAEAEAKAKAEEEAKSEAEAKAKAEEEAKAKEEAKKKAEAEAKAALSPEVASFAVGYSPKKTDKTRTIDDPYFNSLFAVLIDVDTNTIIAGKESGSKMYPASMTKILTVLTAADYVSDLDEQVTVPQEAIDYAYEAGCSTAGYEPEEVTTVRDLFYGTILPSGADAAYTLAVYCAGSQEEFVSRMNAKAEALGLSDSCHFTNCIGLYNDDLYCTAIDMAMILKAAVENDFCREVLSTHHYILSSSEIHPDGLDLSNMFLRRIEDKETPGEVVAAKTGFVTEAGSCAASYFVSDSGHHYICVTGFALDQYICIDDHVFIYNNYTE